MTLAAAAARSEPVRPVSTKENLLTLFGGIWLTAGLFIDGYAHTNLIEAGSEPFFTPWHGIFYSGFAFTVGWVSFIMYRRRTANGIRSWIPHGYGWAVIGLASFAIGGVSDSIWHTLFGVEAGIDALLAPAHLFLLFGLILVLAAPLHVVTHHGGPIWVAIGSTTILAALAAFFTTFARPLSSAWVLTIPFDPETGENDRYVSATIGGIIVVTLIMVFAALYLIQRFDNLPFGTFTVLWGAPALFEAVALSTTIVTATVAGVAGGLTLDLMLRSIQGDRRFTVIASLMTASGVTWSAWTLMHHIYGEGVVWPAQVWIGQIFVSLLIAGGVGLLALPNIDADSTPQTIDLRDRESAATV